LSTKTKTILSLIEKTHRPTLHKKKKITDKIFKNFILQSDKNTIFYRSSEGEFDMLA
jgi:hypothetical protein